MKTEYLILEDDTLAEKVFSDGEKIEMFYSDSEVWSSSIRGDKIGHLKDDGHSIRINVGGHKMELGYDTYCYLCNLIKIKELENPNICATTRIVKIDNQ